MAKMTVCFTLDPEKDKRLVRWLDGLPNRGRSKAIREALADYLGQDDVTHRDILEAIRRLDRRGVAMTAQESADTQDDDPELAAALENLSKLGL
jgi:hypothetical protein